MAKQWWEELKIGDLSHAGWRYAANSKSKYVNRDFPGCIFTIEGARRLEAMRMGEFASEEKKREIAAEVAEISSGLDEIGNWFIRLEKLWEDCKTAANEVLAQGVSGHLEGKSIAEMQLTIQKFEEEFTGERPLKSHAPGGPGQA